MRKNEISVTEALCRYVSDLKYESLPDAVVQRVKLLFIDYLRVVVLGSQKKWGKSVCQLINNLGGTGNSETAVFEGRLDSPRAALINGTFAGGLDWDDTHVGSMSHPGIVIFPAAIAVAEQLGSSGKDLIEAIVAAYDTTIRIGLSIQPSHFKRGFQSTPTCGVFGAAVAVAKLMKFDFQNIVSTFGIAGSYASGVTQFYRYGSEVKRIHAGKSAESGVMSALLVKSGIDGPPFILEGEFGFCHAYSNDFFPDAITDNLGKDYKIMETTIRANACSARIQAALEAVFHINETHFFSLSTIERIVIGIPKIIAGRLTLKEPSNLQSAQLSIPFSVALALWQGHRKQTKAYLSIDDYEANIQNQDVQFLSSLVECIVEDDIEKKVTEVHVPARVEIRFKGGAKIVHQVDIPTGSPEKPFDIEELKERFLSQVNLILHENRVAAILNEIDNLQTVEKISQITRLVKAN